MKILQKEFNYSDAKEFTDAIRDYAIPYSDDISPLLLPIDIYGKTVPNRMVLQPMEGCDGQLDGRPDELTVRRYNRFAAGGAGLVWFEATAVVNEGRANPRQLFINQENYGSFKSMLDNFYKISYENNGYKPYTVLQLTHSGRYSRPGDRPAPMVARRNDYLDKPGLDYRIITDDELDALADKYAEAAVLAAEMGFNAVDIKCCHGYLIIELLGAVTREGRYGGSFENRTRFLFEVIDRVKAAAPGIDITLRLNAYDEVPYPFGFCADRDDFQKPELSEAKALIRRLSEKGIRLINITAGNPYYNPHVNRPYDKGFYSPPSGQLAYIEKILNATAELKKEAGDMVFIASAFSWMREYAASTAAGGITSGMFDMAGFGRQAFAYPDFARDIILQGGMERKKCCIACTKCTELMRFGGTAGCVIKDGSVYAPLYKKYGEGKESAMSDRPGDHL